MNKEKLILSIVAILLGLFVAGGAFYIFQVTRAIDEPQPTASPIITTTPTQLQESDKLLILDDPKDEQVFNKRIINIKGKTMPDATVIVSSSTTDEVVTPNQNGEFTLTHTLTDGVNILKVTAVFEDGSETSVTRTITSTSEEF